MIDRIEEKLTGIRGYMETNESRIISILIGFTVLLVLFNVGYLVGYYMK